LKGEGKIWGGGAWLGVAQGFFNLMKLIVVVRVGLRGRGVQDSRGSVTNKKGDQDRVGYLTGEEIGKGA